MNVLVDNVSAGTDAWYVTKIVCRRRSGANLIVDGTITGAKIGANEITAEKIAANQIQAKHLVVGGWGSAINMDPDMADPDSWYASYGSFTIQTVSDGKEGNKTLRSTTGSNCYVNDKRAYPVDKTKTYRLSFWARADGTGGGRGTLYSCLRQYKDAGTTPCDNNGGRSPYKPAAGVAAHTAWAYYSAQYTPADFQADCRFVFVDFLLNYSGTAGYWEIHHVLFEECVPADVIVDGAITAAKVGTNEIVANTANIKDLVVSTAKIGNNAVTIPTSAYSASEITVPAMTLTTIQELTFTSTGANVNLIFSADMYSTAAMSGYVQIFRGSTMIRETICTGSNSYFNVALSHLDTPSAGSVTYYVKAYFNTAGWANRRSLIALEVKK
jgi:hypothetical protein